MQEESTDDGDEYWEVPDANPPEVFADTPLIGKQWEIA
jgi:hypothetical protein